jgi:RNA polymerase sigma-70 factor, ECF subfamily
MAALRVTTPATVTTEDDLEAFLRARPRLFGLAYRILGSAADAEDVVQDTWVRWQTADRGLVRNSLAFLVTVATRLAINVRQSAHARQELCPMAWPAEPVDPSDDPWSRTERGEAVDMAVLLLLEKLSSTERAAYVLREAFTYPYREIASVLDVGEANARQLVTRARERLSGGRLALVRPGEQARLRTVFMAAASTGELATLERLFATNSRRRRAGSRPSRPGADSGHPPRLPVGTERLQHEKEHRPC